MIRQIRSLKNKVVTPGVQPRSVLFGPLRGIRYGLDLHHETQLYLGLYEKETHDRLSELVQGVRAVADVGAAFGYYTLFFLLKSAAVKVAAFEPSDRQTARLRENLKLNGLEGDDRLILSSQFVGATGGANQVTLDSFFENQEGPILVKLDVEGAELDVLKGANRLIERTKCRWFIETHSRELENECRRFLEGKGYRVAIIGNAWWRALIPELRPLEHNRWLVAV